jgi:hypothetical protein
MEAVSITRVTLITNREMQLSLYVLDITGLLYLMPKTLVVV